MHCAAFRPDRRNHPGATRWQMGCRRDSCSGIQIQPCRADDHMVAHLAPSRGAALVAYDTFNPARQRLADNHLLNAVLVLMLVTSILGPTLTERFAAALLQESAQPESPLLA